MSINNSQPFSPFNLPNLNADSLFKAIPFEDQFKLLYDQDKPDSVERLWPLCDERIKETILTGLIRLNDEKSNEWLQNLFDRSDEKLQFQVLDRALTSDSIMFSLLWVRTPALVKKHPDIEKLLRKTIRDNKYLAMTLLFQDASKEIQISGLGIAGDEAFPKLWALASQEVKDYLHPPGIPWLQFAIANDLKGIVEFLLKEGFNVRTVLEGGKTPYLSALERIDSLGESIVDDIRKKDGVYSDDMIKCRLFGHRFELTGHYFEKTATRKIEWITDSIIKTTKEFTANPLYPDSFPSARGEDLVEAFTLSTKDVDQLYTRSRTKATLVNSGWKGHVVTAIFTPAICAKIDTGTGKRRGISFYKIKTIDQERVKSVIKGLKENVDCSEVEGEKYFDVTMDKELDLEFVGFISQKQVVGNCGYTANACALLGLMIFQQMTGMKDFTAKQLATIYSEVYPDFARWQSFDRYKSLNETLPILKKYPKYFDFDQIVSKIITDCIASHEENSLITIIKAKPSLKDWKNPLGWPLSRWALHSRNIKLFIFLMKLGVDFSPDKTGESIYDDLKKVPLTEKETQLIRAKLQGQPLNDEAKKFLQYITKELPKNPSEEEFKV